MLISFVEHIIIEINNVKKNSIWPFVNQNFIIVNKTHVGMPKNSRTTLRSRNPNMIDAFAKQSQTCQPLKILKTIFFPNIENKLWKVVQSISCWTDKEK